MEVKKKICKHGINKARGFEGCGKETFKTTYGLCPSCLYSFYTTDERGKILYQKSFLPKVSLKLKSFDKAKTKQMRDGLKTLSEYEAEAKKVFQKWVRMRDVDLPCISCGTTKPVKYDKLLSSIINLYNKIPNTPITNSKSIKNSPLIGDSLINKLNLNILIAEDNYYNRIVIKELLLSCGILNTNITMVDE